MTGWPMSRAWIFAAALLCACSPPRPPASAPDVPVWVAREISGGTQCQSTTPFRAPQTVDLLRAVGVEAMETRNENLPVCEACSCPAYFAVHYALIPARQVEPAARAGFQPRNPPRAESP